MKLKSLIFAGILGVFSSLQQASAAVIFVYTTPVVRIAPPVIMTQPVIIVGTPTCTPRYVQPCYPVYRHRRHCR